MRRAGAVEVADHDGEVAEAFVGQTRPATRRVPGGVDERGPQREVLDRVAGQPHLGEGDQVGAQVGGPAGQLEDLRGVAVEVTDHRVVLSEREAQLGHATSVVAAGPV